MEHPIVRSVGDDGAASDEVIDATLVGPFGSLCRRSGAQRPLPCSERAMQGSQTSAVRRRRVMKAGPAAAAPGEATETCGSIFVMPTISRFIGIVIAMYFDDHGPPHFHARHADGAAKVRIDTLEPIDSTLAETFTVRARLGGAPSRGAS